MTKEQTEKLLTLYRDGLLNDTLPFWMPHSLDREHGGFILEEARLRGNRDARLIELGTRIIDWSLEIGWDPEFGGILYFRDAKGLPCTEYCHDMKFWWPHNEAIIATLLAYQMTGDEKYSRWHRKVHDWAYAHFPDPEHGEWFGYLHRDGTVSTTLKGNMWKGFFHPRMQWYCWQRLAEMVYHESEVETQQWQLETIGPRELPQPRRGL